MNLLDAIIIGAAAASAVCGYRGGAVTALMSFLGSCAGALIGVQLARPVTSLIAGGRSQVPIAVVLVLVLAGVGQVGAVKGGGRLKTYLANDPRPKTRLLRSEWLQTRLLQGAWLKTRRVRGLIKSWDAEIGGVLAVLAVLVVSWTVLVPLAFAPYPRLVGEATQSRILRGINDVVPDQLHGLNGSLRSFFNRSGYPSVMGDLPSASSVAFSALPTMTPALARTAARARRSVFKVYGQAPSCDRTIKGTGFVYAKHRILTDAHVVAGVRHVFVQNGTGLVLPATVVLYDPRGDDAVLAVPGLSAPPLAFRPTTAHRGETGIIVGYPSGGGFTVRPARIRARATLRGRDIYNDLDVGRIIYSVSGIVRSGNSGGPLIDKTGHVLGMVFATSLDSSDTGYALTEDQIRSDSDAGINRSAAVNTQDCTDG